MVETMQIATTRETNEIANNSNTNSRRNEEKGSGVHSALVHDGRSWLAAIPMNLGS